MSDERDVSHATPAPEGALCALHPTTVADGICARCGNYMCAYCSEQRAATECLACRERVGSGEFPFNRESWSLFALLDYAWQVFRHYWLKLTLMSAAMLITSQVAAFAFGAITGPVRGHGMAVALALPGIVAIFQMGIQIGGQLALSSWSLRAIEARPLEFDDALRALRRWPQALLAILIFGVPIVVVMVAVFGLAYLLGDRLGVLLYVLGAAVAVLAIIAAMYASVGVMFTVFALVDDTSLDAVGAVRKSWEMAEGRRWRLLGAMALLGLIAASGVALCFVGVFATMAYSSLAMACVYNALRTKEARR